MLKGADILSWFTGNALTNATIALNLLEDSALKGEWLPGASRKVKAAFSKSSVAQRTAREVKHVHDIHMMLAYGVEYMPRYVLNRLPIKLSIKTACEFNAYEVAERYVQDFAPVRDLMAKLDRTRPLPTFTNLGVSPTITKTLEDLNLVPATVRLCPIRWEEEERFIGKTKIVVRVGYLEWPMDTQHGRSRFGQWKSRVAVHQQCEACGHAIKNAQNWVPFVINNHEGASFSMWVGKDCAERLFGVKVKGEFLLADGQRTAG